MAVCDDSAVFDDLAVYDYYDWGLYDPSPICNGVVFWEADVEGCKPFDVILGKGEYLYLNKATLIDTKREQIKEPISLHVIPADGNEFVFSYLHPDLWPSQELKLLMMESFRIFHLWKNGSVYFGGLKQHHEGHEWDQDLEDEESLKERQRQLKIKGKAKALRRSVRRIPEASGYFLRSKPEASGYLLRSKTEASTPSVTPAIGSSRRPNIL